ncbi:MAG: isoamylase early set domain-containing protein [Pseudomonadota bacterium]
MGIQKQYLKNRPVCKVTFKIQKEDGNGTKAVHLVGEFNNWNPAVTPMKPHKNGSFSTTIDLDVDKEYQFRYLMDGVNWKNDPKADTYRHCSYGNCENSVIIL